MYMGSGDVGQSGQWWSLITKAQLYLGVCEGDSWGKQAEVRAAQLWERTGELTEGSQHGNEGGPGNEASCGGSGHM